SSTYTLVSLIFTWFLLCHVRGLGRVVFSLSCFSLVLPSLVMNVPCGRGAVPAHPRDRTRTGGTAPARHPSPEMVLASAGRGGDAPSDAFLAGAIQSAARSVRRGDERNSAVAFVPGSLSVVSEARRGLPEHGAFKSAFHQQFNRHC